MQSSISSRLREIGQAARHDYNIVRGGCFKGCPRCALLALADELDQKAREILRGHRFDVCEDEDPVARMQTDKYGGYLDFYAVAKVVASIGDTENEP